MGSGLSRGERLAFWAATLFTAATRIWGLARSPWDWDEMLFSLALRHYDVAAHHPHPPGFPLFIAAAHLFRAAGLSDFRSLQALNLIAGVLLVPAMVFFCRELGMRFQTSLLAALLFAFFPNVWFFGETAFSDVPSIVLVVFACGLMLRGRRSGRAYFWGVVAIALAGAMRPQNLVIGFAPFVIATWSRRRIGLALLSVLTGVLIIAVSYGAAAALTGGWARYSEALRVHQEYITSTDSFRNPNRPPLHHLLDDFFVRPYHAPLINTFVTVFALLSLGVAVVRRRIPVLIAVAAFSPFCLIAWLLLDHFSASRFSIGFAPMIAILAADGLEIASMGRQLLEWILGLALTAFLFVWTIPAIDLPRRSDSPPVQAMSWVRAHVRGARVLVHESVGPYAEYFLDPVHVEWVYDGPPIARLDPAPAWYLKEGRSRARGAVNMSWPRDRTSDVARPRYLDVSITPLTGVASFGEGWYDEEREGSAVWRWMGARGSVQLPPIPGKARLKLRLFVPLHVMRTTPQITIAMNGRLLKRIAAKTPFLDFEEDVDGAFTSLSIETDTIVNPSRQHLGDDSRDLGLRLDQLEWIGLSRQLP